MMRLFLYELKRIWSWQVLMLIFFVNIFLNHFIISFDIDYFPNGQPDTQLYEIGEKIIPMFGSKIDAKEYEQLEQMYEEEVKKANAFLSNDPEARKLHLDTYEKLGNIDFNDEQAYTYYDEVFSELNKEVALNLQAYEIYMDIYKEREDDLTTSLGWGPSQQQKLHKLADEQKHASYTDIAIKNFDAYKMNVAVVIFLSIIILLSPVFMRDKMANVVAIQYTTKKGRRSYRIKWLAGLVSGFVMTLLLIVSYTIPYLGNHLENYYNLPLSTFAWYYSWYDLTFIDYIWLSVGVVIVLSILLSILTLTISTIVQNMSALIGVQIVVAFLMIMVGAVFIVQELIKLQYMQYAVPATFIGFAIIVIVSARSAWTHEMKRDIV